VLKRMDKKFLKYISCTQKILNRYLNNVLPKQKGNLSVLHKAMYYSVFPGGKRFRPLLAIASAQSCGGTVKQALPLAAGIELIHSYSLVHDDLPAMDNSRIRRGRLSCFARFGEDVAILAGDALLTIGFGCVAENKRYAAVLTKEIARSCGHFGMIEGQMADINLQKKFLPFDVPTLEYINTLKTGFLIAASAKCGAIVAGANKRKVACIEKFGTHLGFMFQMVDDMMDKEGYAKILNQKSMQLKIEEHSKYAVGTIEKAGIKKDMLLNFVQWLTLWDVKG
jgi:geranylgeranyl diphosphate synthase type II